MCLSLSVTLTSPFNLASLSLPRTTATFFPMAVFSGMPTEVSEVMSNSGLLSFSSRMVIETCQVTSKIDSSTCHRNNTSISDRSKEINPKIREKVETF